MKTTSGGECGGWRRGRRRLSNDYGNLGLNAMKASRFSMRRTDGRRNVNLQSSANKISSDSDRAYLEHLYVCSPEFKTRNLCVDKQTQILYSLGRIAVEPHVWASFASEEVLEEGCIRERPCQGCAFVRNRQDMLKLRWPKARRLTALCCSH